MCMFMSMLTKMVFSVVKLFFLDPIPPRLAADALLWKVGDDDEEEAKLLLLLCFPEMSLSNPVVLSGVAL